MRRLECTVEVDGGLKSRSIDFSKVTVNFPLQLSNQPSQHYEQGCYVCFPFSLDKSFFSRSINRRGPQRCFQSVRIVRPINQVAHSANIKFTPTARHKISNLGLQLNFSPQPFASGLRDQCTENKNHKLGSQNKMNNLSFHFLWDFRTICKPKGA